MLSKPRIDSLSKPITPVIQRQPYLPEPDWSLRHPPRETPVKASIESVTEENIQLRTNLQLAYDQVRASQAINEAANAQLVVQYLQASRMNAALLEKEEMKKKKKGERIGGDGKGLVYTSTDVMDTKRKLEEEAQQKAAERASRDSLRALVREAKEKIKRDWVEMQRAHTESSSKWKAEVAHLKEQKVPKSQWPKAPTRPKKPTLPPELRLRPRKQVNAPGEHDQRGSVSGSEGESDTDGD